MLKKTIAVIGAGISGISAARIFKERGYKVRVFEKKSELLSQVPANGVGGSLFHRFGDDVFHGNDKIVQDWFWRQFDKDREFNLLYSRAKILLRGNLIGYPIENYLYQLDKETIEAVVTHVLKLAEKGYQGCHSYASLSDFLQGNFGEKLYHLFFEPYYRKFWDSDLSKIPFHWLEGHIPRLDLKQLLLRNIFQANETGIVPDAFYSPKHSGTPFILQRLAEGVDVFYNFPVERLKFENGTWLFNGANRFDHVIFSGDVRQLENVLATDDPVLKRNLHDVSDLKSSGTSTMLCETDPTDFLWLYLPGREVNAHRIVYSENFNGNPAGKGKRKKCIVQFSGKVSEAEMKKDLAFLPGNLVPVAFNYEPHSSVIQEADTRLKIHLLKSKLTPLKFFLCGRFAEWEAYNIDQAILAALTIPLS